MEAVIFIGLQASGKSTFYKEHFFKTHIRINLDMLKTRHRESLLLKSCIEMKQSFVVDNTNPTIEDRKRYLDVVKDTEFQMIGYYFQSQLTACITRNSNRSEVERIPERGIRGVYSKLEIPTLDEGFDRLYYVSIKETGEFVIGDWKDEI